MIIGVPKELKAQEDRVGLLPTDVSRLVERGHEVLVGHAAGSAAGFSDAEYLARGAKIVADAREIYERAELIVKVKEPLPEEFALLRKGQLIFTYLHLAANRPLTEALLQSGCTAIAYESVEVNRRHPLLEPMSEIAGRMSVIVGGNLLSRPCGGTGVLLGGVPGVLPGIVAVVGGGTAGVNAARMASGLGADVTILEVDVEKMRSLDATVHSLHTLFSSPAHLSEMMPKVDLLIGAVLVPGARAPKLITQQMLRLMKPGGVFVDIAIDQGGCSETSRATTHLAPTYVEEGITHYCVANMPAAYARTATQALTNVTTPYVELLANHGLEEALTRSPALRAGVNIHDGAVTCRPVALAHEQPFAEMPARSAATAS